MKRVLVLTVFITVIGFAAETLYAQRGPGRGMEMRGPQRGPGGRMGEECGPGRFFGDPERFKERLGLSDEQVKNIGGINDRYHKQFIMYREQMAPLHAKLQRELLKSKVNLEEVRTLLKKIADINVEIRLLKIKHHLEIEDTLTPEQRSKLRGEKRELRRNCPYPER